jgi:hypothetical protein
MRFRVVPSAAGLLTVLALARGAAAAPTEAARRAAREFVEGQKAFQSGDYVRAAESFEAAYRDKPHHSPLWNAARSWQRAGEDIRAANLYARYLREAPADAPDRDQATVSLKELTAKVGRVEIHTAPGIDKPRLDGKDADQPVVYVAPGEHVAEGMNGARPVRKVVRVSAGQTVSVTIAEEAPPPPKVVIVQAPPPAEEPRGVRVLPPVVAIVGGALAVVGGGLTVASGLDTVSKKRAFLDDPTQPKLDDAFSSQTRTNVLLGTTIGVAVVSGVVALVFTDWKGRREPAKMGALP